MLAVVARAVGGAAVPGRADPVLRDRGEDAAVEQQVARADVALHVDPAAGQHVEEERVVGLVQRAGRRGSGP